MLTAAGLAGAADSDWVARAVALAEELPPGSVIALYLYGSVLRGEADAWSDVDLCLIFPDTPTAWTECPRWANRLLQESAFRVDPLVLCETTLGADAPVELAVARACLLRNSRLLIGEEVRDRVAPPSPRVLALDACACALRWVRQAYEIPPETDFPERPAALDPARVAPSALGNAAWRVYMTTLHLLRALVLLTSGELPESKAALLRAASQSLGEPAGQCCVDATALRRTLPRFDALPHWPPELPRLGRALPALAEQVRSHMRRRELADLSQDRADGG